MNNEFQKARILSCYGISTNDIEKGHKYIRKEPDGRGGWNYIYKEKENRIEKIKKYAARVIEGKEYINRLSQEEEQGRIKGGRRNVEATILLKGNEGTNSEDFKEAGKIAKIQEQLLEDYAKKEGLWVDFYGQRKYWDFLGSGEEARVYRLDDFHVKKVVNYDIQSLTPLEFIDNRISLQNYLFPEASYELIGFCRTSEGFAFIVKQRYIREVSRCTPEEVSAEMTKLGFESIGGNDYMNENYVVSDLHGGNVVKNEIGEIFFIDPSIYLNLESEGQGGTRDYNKI